MQKQVIPCEPSRARKGKPESYILKILVLTADKYQKVPNLTVLQANPMLYSTCGEVNLRNPSTPVFVKRSETSSFTFHPYADVNGASTITVIK